MRGEGEHHCCDAMRDAQVQDRDVLEGTALDARSIHACRDSRYSRAGRDGWTAMV